MNNSSTSRRFIGLIAIACAASTTLAASGAAPAPQPVSPSGAPGQAASRLDKDIAQKGRAMMAKAIAWLRTQQDEKSGGWAINPDAKAMQFPAITGLVVNGMLLDPSITRDDPAVAKGVKYILSMQQPDGGIYDRQLQSYNTAICISALTRAGGDEAHAAADKALKFLRTLQYGEDAMEGGKETMRVTRDHPFYGGVGYGGGGRPDNSNLNFFLTALQDAGVDCKDPAVQRAMVFLSRTQMLGTVNDQDYAKGSKQGGFIYATSPNKDNVGRGESKADTIEETMDDGTKVSRLRAYGSMTYAGFKSYLYAQLPRDDERVKAAYDWIKHNYTLDENPGAGVHGMYYFYVTFSRAMDALGEPSLVAAPPESTEAKERFWAVDLINKLSTLQNEDGSFKSLDNRWMENNPVLITAYSVIALGHAAE
ncbi:MAG TPA: prenyltransferase/squalene oxidase repeat-containing protein [Phycisphaerales bacterium]|nr:prenyltransferase/squalene oxidase repeat-containing protein [Phycisphaerales bacterium]